MKYRVTLKDKTFVLINGESFYDIVYKASMRFGESNIHSINIWEEM